MAGLPKSTLKVLVQGQEQDIVQRLVPPGAGLVVENMFFDHQGNLVKRYGSAALATTTIPAGVTFPRPWAFGKHRGSLVVLGRQGQAPLMEYDGTHGKWMAPSNLSPSGKGAASWSRGPMVATPIPVARQMTAGNSFDHHDADVGNGYLCVTFQESTPTTSLQVHKLLIDVATRQCVMDKQIPTGGRQLFPHVTVVAGRYACFAYNGNGTLTVDVHDLQAADPTATTTTSVLSEPIVDSPIEAVASPDGVHLLVGYRGQSGHFRVAVFTPSPAAFASIINLKTQAAGAIAAANGFCWVQNFDGATYSNNVPPLITIDPSTGVMQHVGFVTIDATNYAAGRTTVIDAAESVFVLNVAAGTVATGTGTSIPMDVIYYTTSGTVPVIKHASVASGGTAAVDTNAIQMFLASRLFRDAGGKSCYLVGSPWQTQATFYVLPVRPPGNAPYPSPLCRSEVQTAYPTQVGNHLPMPALFDASTVYLTASVQTSAPIAGFPSNVNANVDAIKIQFRNGVEPTLPAPNLGNPIEAIESMLTPGGQLMQWDGKYYGHAGFAYAPQTPSKTNTAGGALTAGYSYSYCAVYVRTDAQGRKWRSAPSPVLTAVGAAGISFVLTVNYLQLVDQPGVVVEFYRDTAVFPGQMQRLPVTIPNVHDNAASPFATYTDGNSDATVLQGELLYTTGGILPNAITPGVLSLCVFNNRVWFVSADDPQSLWCSAPLTPPGTGGYLAGAGLYFNSAFIVDVRDERGPITGLGTCDGRMVVFKHDAIYTIDGTGPDGTGAGATYITARIAGDVGSDNPRSIVDAFDGVWFQSSSARAPFWRLDRGTSLQYVGAGVRDFGGLPVVGGLSLPEQSQIRWYTYDGATGGHVLVYDVIAQCWTTYVNPMATTSAACAIALNGAAAWASESASHLGIVMLETPGLYADAGDVFGQRVVFPWLQLADLNGYQRVFTYQGIGATVADHLIRVNLYRDLLDSNQAFAGQDYSMLLSANPGWDWEVRFPMKLSAVKAELIGQPTKIDGTTPTAGFAMSGMSIEFAVKAGLKPSTYTHRLTHS